MLLMVTVTIMSFQTEPIMSFLKALVQELVSTWTVILGVKCLLIYQAHCLFVINKKMKYEPRCFYVLALLELL